EEIQQLSTPSEAGSAEKIQGKQNDLKGLQEDLANVVQKIQEVEKERTPLQDELAPLKNQKDQYESSIRSFQSLLKNYIRDVQSLQNEVDLLESQSDPQQAEVLKKAKELLQQKLVEQEKATEILFKQIAESEEKKYQLEPTIKALIEKIEPLTEKIEILEGKKSRIQKQRLQNLFGTDMYGRDVFARIVHGTCIALLIGFVSMGIASIIGIIMGGIAGFFGGWVDSIISRFIDLIMAIPTMILILALIAIVERPTIWDLMIVIGLTSWVTIARLTRGEFLKLKNMDYVMAGQALGFSNFRIMSRHILPNSLAPVIVNVTFGIASAILTESGLSFLGFGVQEPTPSWGSVLSNGFKSGLTDYWLIGFSSFAIFVAIFTYNVVGDGLQEALDPRLK
ncbi:MAG: ABC transporter permease subunit, partial [Planctomycetota bacterium]